MARFFRLLKKAIDCVGPKIARILVSKGGIQIASPQGFIVKGKDGPLAPGELEKASKWIKQDMLKSVI